MARRLPQPAKVDAHGNPVSGGLRSIVVGFALFAMFFGAGNLIFPPTLGQDSGTLWFWGFLGFLLMDAVLACVGIFAVSVHGGPREAFRQALGQRGSVILNTAAVLCLCVLFAMPRTAATTYELSVAPYAGEAAGWLLIPFSVVFFAVVYLLACRQSRVVDIIGKFFTPTLVVGICILIVVGIVHPLGGLQPPRTPTVFQEGIRAGYQSMDVLGVSAFALIILDSTLVKSTAEGAPRRQLLARASLVAIILLGIIYGGLTYLGATSVGLGTEMTQADLLMDVVYALLGDAGVVLLSVIVLLACLTTAVALVSSAADFFSTLANGRISYRAFLVADCIIGALICDMGLDAIIQISDPVLGVVYPPFITVVILLLFRRKLRVRAVYQGAAMGAFVGGLLMELANAGILSWDASWLPLASMGFGWFLFAVAGAVVGVIVWFAGGKRA